MAQRIQRQRVKGWRMPEGARYVGRPSCWGNPFKTGGLYKFVGRDGKLVMGVAPVDPRGLVDLFDEYISVRVDIHEHIREELGGRDLACWCPLVDEQGNRVPCHADVLLRIANEAVA